MNKRTITINEPLTDIQGQQCKCCLLHCVNWIAVMLIGILTHVTTSNGTEALIIYYHMVGWCIQTYEATT